MAGSKYLLVMAALGSIARDAVDMTLIVFCLRGTTRSRHGFLAIFVVP